MIKKYKWWIIGAAALALGSAYMKFSAWKGTGTNTKAGTFTAWLLNATGLKKDASYN